MKFEIASFNSNDIFERLQKEHSDVPLPAVLGIMYHLQEFQRELSLMMAKFMMDHSACLGKQTETAQRVATVACEAAMRVQAKMSDATGYQDAKLCEAIASLIVHDFSVKDAMKESP